MIQYKIIGPSWVYRCPSSDSVIIDDNGGGSYILNGEIGLYRYRDNAKIGLIEFHGILWKVITTRDVNKDIYESVLDGDTYLESENGDILTVDPIIIFCLIFNREPDNKRFRVIPASAVRSEESEFIFVDLESESYEKVLCDSNLRPFIIDNNVYGIQWSPEKRILKYDLGFDLEWVFKFNSDRPKKALPRRGALNYKSSVIFDLGMRRQKKNYLDGVVCALAKSDGSVAWKQTFEFQVEDLDLLNDHQIIASTGNQLVVLDADRGKVVREIDLGMELQTYSRFLFVSDAYVFLFCKKNQVMQIYDKATLELLRHFDAKEPNWFFVERPKVIDNKLFLVVGLKPVYGGVVVLDLENIRAPLQYESEPGISISTPDQDNGAIVMQVDTSDLGAVLRFTEMYGLQHAENEGDEGRGLDKNPHFNGEVLLKYSGYTRDREEVIEKLEILKRRFDYYASDMKLYCGRGKHSVTFDYELL